MRHHNVNRKFNRVKKVRKALLNSLVRSLVLHNRIKTTEPKAKEIRPIVEKFVTQGKIGTIAAKRALIKRIGPKATKIVMEDLAKKYEKRAGGFVRIIKSKPRLSDGSKMAVIEFI